MRRKRRRREQVWNLISENGTLTEIPQEGICLLQNADGSRQFLMVKSAAPFSILVAVGHASETAALDQEKFMDKWRRPIAFSSQFGAVPFGVTKNRRAVLRHSITHNHLKNFESRNLARGRFGV